MRVEWRAGGISSVLLARAILYKVCPAFGIGRGGFSLARFCADQGELARIAGRTAFCRSGFSPEFWRFFSRIALCSLCTIMPLRFVQVYKVCYLCKMLLTICGKCAKIQTVREQRTPRQPEGPAEERSGGTVRTLARQDATGDGTLPKNRSAPQGPAKRSTTPPKPTTPGTPPHSKPGRKEKT